MEQIVFPSTLKYVLLSGAETIAFLVVLVVACRRLRDGALGWLGVGGGLLGALSSGIFTVAWAQVRWSDSFEVLDYLGSNPVLQHTEWAQAIAIVLVAATYAASDRGVRSSVRP